MKKFWQKVKSIVTKKVSMNVFEIITFFVIFFVVWFLLVELVTSTAEKETFTDGVITAKFDEESETLTFSCRGAVDGFRHRELKDLTPKQRASVRTIIFEDGITSIGDCEFSDRYFINLETVIFEGDINTIGDCAFSTNYNLTTVQFNGNCRRIGDLTFFQCAALDSINIPDGCKLCHGSLSWTPFDEDRS